MLNHANIMMRNLLPLLLVTCSGIVSSETREFDSQATLESICKGQEDVTIEKITEMISLLDKLEESQDHLDCDAHIIESISDLIPLIGEGTEDVCGAEKVSQIKDYYIKYVLNENEKSKSRRLPKPIRDFFIALGMRISATCKKTMINSLLYDATALLTKKDFEIMDTWTSDKTLASKVMRNPSDFDDLLLVGELSTLKESSFDLNDDDPEEGDDRMFIKTATGDKIREMQVTCHRRYKPIYEQLIKPLITLSNIGFNYQGEDLEREIREITMNGIVHRWYKIVYLCESLIRVIIIDDFMPMVGENPEMMSDTTVKSIQVFTEEEAQQIGATTEPIEYEMPQLGQISYRPPPNPLENQILPDDANFKQLVDRYNMKISLIDRVRCKVIKKIANLAKDVIERGDFRLLGSIFGGYSPTTKRDVVSAIDAYVRERTNPQYGFFTNLMNRLSHNKIKDWLSKHLFFLLPVMST